MSEQGALWDSEDLNCLQCGRPLNSLGRCEWCNPPDRKITGRSGPELKESGMALANSKHVEWQGRVHSFILTLRGGRQLTAEEITDSCGLPTVGHGSNKNNSVGATMNALAKAGLIRKTGEYVKSSRPERHSAMIAVWERTHLGSEPHDYNPDSPVRPDPVPPTPDSTTTDCPRCGGKLVSDILGDGRDGCLSCGWLGNHPCFTCGSTDHRTYDCPGCPDCGKYNGRHTDGCTRT
jgi:predicted nucleic acid-binding Zn ribbon protein